VKIVIGVERLAVIFKPTLGFIGENYNKL